jgi:hypothetical protein
VSKDAQRLRCLRDAQEKGIIHFAAQIENRFHIRVSETADSRQYTGTQVDAFLFGIRVGQISADKPFARTT